MVTITEIEIGPHFLTLYGTPRTELYKLGRDLQPKFEALRPELSGFQQKGFAHEPNDPRVYHPYGEPASIIKKGRVFKKENMHFHIRYGYRPSRKDIEQVIELLSQLGVKSAKTAPVVDLEASKAFDWDYPPVPENKAEYLQYIKDIRDNKYNSKV